MQQYLIVGASSGIGKEVARQLAEAGKQVVATYNKNKPTDENPNMRFHQLNVLDDTIASDYTDCFICHDFLYLLRCEKHNISNKKSMC